MLPAVAAILTGTALAGCNLQIGGGNIDQKQVCEVSSVDLETTNAACTPGQKVAFMPSRFGNEQLPVVFAAVNCDHRYEIAMTKGGVSCIFHPIDGASNQNE